MFVKALWYNSKRFLFISKLTICLTISSYWTEYILLRIPFRTFSNEDYNFFFTYVHWSVSTPFKSNSDTKQIWNWSSYAVFHPTHKSARGAALLLDRVGALTAYSARLYRKINVILCEGLLLAHGLCGVEESLEEHIICFMSLHSVLLQHQTHGQCLK